MTAKIFSKDLRLAAHPMMYVFALFGVMLIIPNYPYTVVFFYGLLGIFQQCHYILAELSWAERGSCRRHLQPSGHRTINRLQHMGIHFRQVRTEKTFDWDGAQRCVCVPLYEAGGREYYPAQAGIGIFGVCGRLFRCLGRLLYGVVPAEIQRPVLRNLI